MSDIVWEEPASTAGRGQRRWAEITAELKKHPGKWALVGENEWSGVSLRLKRVYGLDCTVRGTTQDGRAAKIYARWPEDAS